MNSPPSRSSEPEAQREKILAAIGLLDPEIRPVVYAQFEQPAVRVQISCLCLGADGIYSVRLAIANAPCFKSVLYLLSAY